MINGNDSINPEGEFTDSNTGNTIGHLYGGLTKREYFSVHLMAGRLGNSEHSISVGTTMELSADLAVKRADALIKELNKN